VVARASAPLARGSDTPAQVTLAGGGSAANVAAWAASLGASVSLVCRVGDDERGRAAVAELRATGVDVHATVDAARATGTCVVVVEPDGERTMLPDPGANDVLEPVALPPGDHLHVSGYTLLRDGSRAAALDALAQASERGITVSVDASSWALLRPGALPAADLLLANAREAAALSGDDDPDRAARALSADGEVVVKLGAGGALWTDGADTIHVPAERVAVTDTTGAGDAFAAGLLAARLAGAGPRETLAAGCRAGARAVTRVGARPPVPSRPGYD
jgi:ribokinase